MKNEPKNISPTDIEKEKDKMDLRPAIKFIEDNLESFQAGHQAIMQRTPSEPARAWAHTLQFPFQENIREPQIHLEEAQEALEKMPDALIALSKLKTVSYEYANQIIEPVYNADGTMKTGNTVLFEAFGQNNEHPTRLLIGMTPNSGDTTYQSALPSTVYENIEAAKLYQLHVLLHEFFHTVEIHMRDPDKRSKIILETDGRTFTFQQWWEEFEELILSRAEKLVSRYAAGYEHDLTPAKKRADNASFTHALAEQVCESFVAHQLNIISNDNNWTDFRGSMPQTWQLMDRLCRAKLVSRGDKIEV